MSVAAVKCPECGAKLQPPPGATQMSCAYCGTVSRVQARTGLFRPPPPPAGDPRQPVAQPWARGAAWRWLLPLIAGSVMVSAIAGYLALSPGAPPPVATHSPAHETTPADAFVAPIDLPEADAAPPPPPPHHTPSIDWPAFADVNGDGVDDLVAFMAPAKLSGSVIIVAVDGATGEKLWETEVLSPQADSSRLLATVAGGVVVTVGPGAQARAFDLGTGAPGWTARLNERPSWWCTAGDGYVELVLADRTMVRIAEDGEVTPRGAAPRNSSRCRPGVVLRDPPRAHRRERAGLTERPLGEMRTWERAWREGGPHVALGGKHPGSPVPMIARYRPPRQVLWQRPVSSVESFELERITFGSHIAFGEDVVVAAFADTKYNSYTVSVAAFELADGAPRWERYLPKATHLLHVAVSGDLVYAKTHGRIFALDVADGTVRWRYGSGF